MAAEKYGRLGRENRGLGFRRWPALVLWTIIQPQRGLLHPNSNKIKIFQHQITSKASPPSSSLLTLRWFYSQWATNGERPQSITLKSHFLALGAPACRHKEPNERFHPPEMKTRWKGQPAESKRGCCGGEEVSRRSVHGTRPLDMPARSISRCINMCHVSHPPVRGDGSPDGIFKCCIFLWYHLVG